MPGPTPSQPGWYDDGSGRERWFDGNAWTDHYRGEAGAGEEVFLYADAALLRTGALWDGLARSGLPVRVYAQGASATQQAEYQPPVFDEEF